MLGMSMSLRCVHSQDLRQTFRAPRPSQAKRGLEGLQTANAVLKRHEAIGVLIGGLAKEIWKGITNPEVLARRKDTDVLVISHNCLQHPQQWAEGIDWWISHNAIELPTNGTSCGIIWQMNFRSAPLPVPGLYLPPIALLRESIQQELRVWGKAFKVKGAKTQFRATPGIADYPILPLDNIEARWGEIHESVSHHCQPC